MAVFEVTAPNGKTLEIEGDTPPSEQELDKIFADMPQDNLEGNGSEEQPFQIGVSKNIDLRPSALADNLAKHIVALPIAGYNALKNKSFKGAYSSALNDLDEAKQKMYELDPLQKKIDNAGNATLDIGATFMLPEVKAFQGAGLGAKIGNSVLTNTYQGGLIGGVEELRHGGNGFGGATIGALGGGAFGAAMPAAGAKFNKMVTSPKFQKGLSGALEVLTSVPQKYSLRALEAELAGNSLFKGKFNPDRAYRPVERALRNAKNALSEKYSPNELYKPIEEKMLEAKSMLPTTEDYAKSYYQLGQRATMGMEQLKEKAGTDIQQALQQLNDNTQFNKEFIQNEINRVIKQFGEGGVYNSAERNAKRVTSLLDDVLNKENLTLRDLHRLKEDLYDIGYQSAGAREGTQAEVARGIANRINDYLRAVSPTYQKPNEAFSLITDINRGVGGDTTIAKQIQNIGSENNILSGLDQKLKDVDMLLQNGDKFYNQAQDLIKNENMVKDIYSRTRGFEKHPELIANIKDAPTLKALDNLERITGTSFLDDAKNIAQDISRAKDINSTIGRQYERNPRLLGNRTDEKFEQALEDLQNETNSDFMEKLNDVRAREALEHWFPGQGGGSGSDQGFANLLRSSVGAGSVGTALFSHNPAVLGAFLSFSPKIMGKGTIKNIGAIYNGLDKIPSDTILKLLYGATRPFSE